MLKLRVLTALILLPLVIWGIFALPQLYFVGVCTAIILLAAWEWTRLSGWVRYWQRGLYVVVTLCALGCIQFVAYLTSFTLVFAVGACWWLLVLVYLVYIRDKTVLPVLPNGLVAASGLLSLAICWEALWILHLRPELLLFMLVLVWLADIFAYFGGRLWGQRKLAVSISPNKTWEGLASGLMVSTVIAGIGQWFIVTPHEFNGWMFLMMILTIVASVVGDLFESVLKRLQSLKDSGQLLPGHGGVLDRIDSLIAAAPVFALGVMATGLL